MEDTDDEHAVKMVRTIELPVELWQKIKLYQHGNQCGSRVAAIRQMLTEAYDAWKARINLDRG